MKIELGKLTLLNFKGIRNLTINLSHLTEIFGENASGKTTLNDAFNWLLFDKDSSNKKDFDIKTLGPNGDVIHGLEHAVEGELFIDGKRTVLKKVYSERWTKKRGSVTAEFTGHTTDYFIDDVPIKAKEYKETIDGLVDESLFKLLTNPTYFNTQLSWQERRKALLEVCGEMTDEEVISSNDALTKLSDILKGRSIEDHRKVIAGNRKRINDELDKLPVRIDEAERSKPDTEGLSESQLQAEIDQLKFEVESKEAEITRLQSGEQVTALQNRVREIEGELLEIKNQSQAGALDAVTQQRSFVNSMAADVSDIEMRIRGAETETDEKQSLINSLKNEAQQLRKEWAEVHATELDDDGVKDACPTCGQSLPVEQVQAAHGKALENFNSQKSQRLEQIHEAGTAKMEKVRRLDAVLSTDFDVIQMLKNQLSTAQANYDEAKRELDRLQAQIHDVTKDQVYMVKQAELEQTRNKIAALRQSSLNEIQTVRSALMDTRDELRRKESLVARFEQVRKLDERIEELRQQERQLAAQYEQLEEELYLTEEFIKTKVQVLESRINSKFRYARFKLFDTQINGGLAETCETLYEGVPYGSGLNNAARINVGLDIINTLSEHYGLSAPIWIDNAESVTELLGTDAQMIALYVSKQDKQLRIETNVKETV